MNFKNAMRKNNFIIIASLMLLIMSSCAEQNKREVFTGADGEVRIITIQPGHFHAALVQKTMYPQVNTAVHVYASEGPELDAHIRLIDSYNHREQDPTNLQLEVYTGGDYREKSLEE